MYAGMVAGLVGGVIAAAGARVAMRVVRTYTEGGIGSFTLEGTLGIVFFLSLPATAAGALYAAVHGRLPGREGAKGLAYGALLLLILGTLMFLSEEEEFGDLVPERPLRVAMFGALFLLYGAVIGQVAPRAERRLAASPSAFALLGLVALAGAGLIAFGLVFFAVQLAQRPEVIVPRLLVWAGALVLAAILLTAPALTRRG